LLLPVLVVFTAAVVVARVLPPALRGLERLVPRTALPLRLASLALARRPGYASVAVGFVVVSVGLALFAETYRWTLVQGQREQAAFAVPADYVASEDISKLIPVRTAVKPGLARSLGGRFVTRQGGSIQGAAALGNVAVLGLDPQTLARIGGWRSDFASRSPRELARLIAWHGATGLRGARLPRSATRVVLPVRVAGTAGVQRVRRGSGIRFALTLTPQVDTYLRPRQPTDGQALPAVVSPRLGAIVGRNGVFGVNVAGQSVRFRALAVARRFPSATSQDTTDFVVADRDALVTALNAAQPGAGFPTELWLDSRQAGLAERLRRPPFDVLSVASRAGLERQLRRDPVARAAVAMLEVAAVTALVLALVGLGLGVVSERRDEAADLFDLEAQGLAPASLRRQLR